MIDENTKAKDNNRLLLRKEIIYHFGKNPRRGGIPEIENVIKEINMIGNMGDNQNCFNVLIENIFVNIIKLVIIIE